jgi:iron complex outermembrane receptor protein
MGMTAKPWLSSSVLAILAMGAAVDMPVRTAYAQAAAQGNDGQLNEIVVTARRTQEKLQQTPVAVSAMDAKMLDNLNVQDTSKIMQFIPNLYLGQGSGSNTNVAISIRGIGQQDPLLTVDSPVGFYVDGVNLSRISALNFDLVDLERVEVLRGPQGTLFGRNTTGGAVNLITKAPANDFSIQEKVGWGQYEGWYTRTSVNTGEIGTTGLKAIIAYMHRDRDGFVDNPYASSANDPGALHSDAVWAKIEGNWDRLKVDYAIDYDSIDGRNEGFTLAAMTPTNIAYYSQSPNYGGDPLVLSGHRRDPLPLYRPSFLSPTQHDVILGHSLTAEYDLNDEVTFKSITGYRRFYASTSTLYGPHFRGPVLNPSAQFNPTIVNGVAVEDTPPFEAPQDVGQYQWSQELQVLGTIDRFKYVAGLFAFYEHVHEDNPNYYTYVIPTGIANPAYLGINLNSELRYRENSASYAAFGQTSYRPPILDDKLEVTGGLRYTIDHRSINLFDLGSIPRNGTVNYYNFNFNFSLNYQLTDDIMSYVRISTGYKAGGFNARVTDATSNLVYSPEKATAYEIGIKSEWLDHKLRLNAAGFYTDYANLQVNQYTGGVGTTTNADAYYEGFELEGQFLPTKELSIDGSVGYVNPVYNYYPYSNPTTGVLTNYASIAHFPYVPDWTIHVGAQYYFPETAFGAPSIRVDYSMMSERYWFGTNLPNANPLNNAIKDPGQNLLSARFILSDIPVFDGRGKMELQVYGTNLLDQALRDSGIDFGGLGFAGVSFGEPRSVGFTLDYKFNAEGETTVPAAAYVPPPVQAPAPAPAPKSYLVFFDFNKSDLTPQAVTIVDTAAKNAAPAKVTQLTVTGHTDTVGSDAYNMRLSRRRAESVAAQLEKDGIPSSEIEIVAKGKRDLLVPTADGVKEPQNRRVQIVYDNGMTS